VRKHLMTSRQVRCWTYKYTFADIRHPFPKLCEAS